MVYISQALARALERASMLKALQQGVANEVGRRFDKPTWQEAPKPQPATAPQPVASTPQGLGVVRTGDHRLGDFSGRLS